MIHHAWTWIVCISSSSTRKVCFVMAFKVGRAQRVGARDGPASCSQLLRARPVGRSVDRSTNTSTFVRTDATSIGSYKTPEPWKEEGKAKGKIKAGCSARSGVGPWPDPLCFALAFPPIPSPFNPMNGCRLSCTSIQPSTHWLCPVLSLNVKQRGRFQAGRRLCVGCFETAIKSSAGDSGGLKGTKDTRLGPVPGRRRILNRPPSDCNTPSDESIDRGLLSGPPSHRGKPWPPLND